MILGILLIILCIVAIIFLVNQNRAYKKIYKNTEEEEAIIQSHYQYLRDKDVILYHKLYRQTLDLLKDCSHSDFFAVFDEYFKEENPALYEEFKNQTSSDVAEVKEEESVDSVDSVSIDSSDENWIEKNWEVLLFGLIVIVTLIGLILHAISKSDFEDYHQNSGQYNQDEVQEKFLFQDGRDFEKQNQQNHLLINKDAIKIK